MIVWTLVIRELIVMKKNIDIVMKKNIAIVMCIATIMDIAIVMID